MKQKRIELLAPAKNFDQGKLAISCGADAVYIGPSKFGARARVGNSIDDIEKLIYYADLYYAKVYATINTLLFDNELATAVDLIYQLYDIGISGIIIQDMGLLEYDLPPVPFIASTQCFVNRPDKAKFFQEAGFQRIILPRELSAVQIAKIREATPDIELEYFVHGALCVGYSGQCYMSYALGGRSGNRGVCAQPCRKLYSVYDEKGNLIVRNKHLLSLKDLNQSENLEKLIDLGIDSFKIEGRLKESNYIKNIVPFYRQKIDELIRDRSISAASSGTVSADFQSDPNKTFNRGYTDYFFNGEQRRVSSIDTPKMRGEYIGKIITVRDNYFILDKSPSLSNGDGIAFFVNDQLHGTNINETRGNKVYPASSQHLKTGTAVYRNYDHQYLSRLKTAPLARNINMVYKIEQTATGLQIIAKDEDDNSVKTVISDFEIARNREAAQKNLLDSLSKTGQTIFACSKIECNLKEFPHFRKSHINKIRRQLLDRLLAERIANKPDRGVRIKPNTFPYPASRLDYRGNVINQKARDFYLRHGVESIEDGIEKRQNIGYPIVMTTKYCIKKELGFCTKDASRTAIGTWKLVDDEGHTFTLIFHCNKCEMDVIREG